MVSIRPATEADRVAMLAVWEDSVRATHDFLSEADIAFYKPLVWEKSLPALAMTVAVDAAGNVVGIMGMAGHHIDMLFVAPRAFRQGIGQALINHAKTQHAELLLDVNEMNAEATVFYLAQGFVQFARSDLDGQGKAFPLLHMRWER